MAKLWWLNGSVSTYSRDMKQFIQNNAKKYQTKTNYAKTAQEKKQGTPNKEMKDESETYFFPIHECFPAENG